jgi:hypothetical protein
VWLRLGVIVLRLGIRLAPFLAAGVVALARRYRWPIYYRSLAYRPAKFSLALVPRIAGLTLLGLLLLGIALYLIVGRLSLR